MNRRSFLHRASTLAAVSPIAARVLAAEPKGRRRLFDGTTLAGWKAGPRLMVTAGPMFVGLPPEQLKAAVVKWHEERPEWKPRLDHKGHWEVIDGAIVGRHEPVESQLGAYLLSDQKFADFELELEARPDWPVDTGIMIRAHELGSVGFQILLDHRPKGGLCGVFGELHWRLPGCAIPTLDGDKEPGFRVGEPARGRRETQFQPPTMNHAATFADFAKVWHANEWNHFRIRCVRPSARDYDMGQWLEDL